MERDYYHILGVPKDAEVETIKRAYFELAKKCHPDRGGSHEAMVLIGEAWEVLSNPESRRRYDEARSRQASDSTNGTTADANRARERAERYPRDWAAFVSWWDRIAKDFTNASYGTVGEGVHTLPTAENSISGWVFIVTGGIAGALVFCLPFLTSLPWGFSLLGLGIKIGIAGAVFGAWLGYALHASIGKALKAADDSTPTSPSEGTERVIIPCEKCGRNLRVPVMERDLVVTCGWCRHRFSHPYGKS